MDKKLKQRYEEDLGVIRKALFSKPIKEVKQIYDAAKSSDTQKAVKKYVVYH